MVRGKSGAGKAMRREAAALISDARATSKHVNVFKEGVSAERGIDEEVRVRIAVAASAPHSLALVVRDAFAPTRPHAVVRVASAEDATVVGGSWDVVVVIADGVDPAAGEAARIFARAGLPVALVAESPAMLPETGINGPAARRITHIIGTDPAKLEEGLASWLVRATGKGLAMAACFPFARHAEVELLVRECAGQNAMIGAFSLVPGSDLPVMAANEIRLAITFATLYGQGASPARILEMLATVGAAMTHRRIAKAVSMPGLGIVIHAGIDYAGTLVACRALARYYERLEEEGGFSNAFARLSRDVLRQVTDSLTGGLAGLGEIS